jgi:hypothetical protein
MRKTGSMNYVTFTGVPKAENIAPNRILAHNDVKPQKKQRSSSVRKSRSFRTWYDDRAAVKRGKYVLCDCGCWGDLTHDRVNKEYRPVPKLRLYTGD